MRLKYNRKLAAGSAGETWELASGTTAKVSLRSSAEAGGTT
jgi:hypothetical protein